MQPTNPFTALVALPFILVASILVHEGGHALAGYLVGFVVTSFGAGFSRARCLLAPRGVRIFLGRSALRGGMTFALMPQIYPSRWRVTVYYSGGILANGLTACSLVALSDYSPSVAGLFLLASGINGFMALTSLLPYRFRAETSFLVSDGGIILKVLMNRSLNSTGASVVQTLNGFRSLWLSIGDTLILKFYLIAGAFSYRGIGNSERALDLIAESLALSGPTTEGLQALTALAIADIAAATGRHEDASHSLDAADLIYRDLGHTAGRFLVSLSRSWLPLARGDAATALAEFERLSADPVARDKPILKNLLLSGRIQSLAALKNLEGITELVEIYHINTRIDPPSPQDILIDSSYAGLLAERGDWSKAEASYQRAVAAVRSVAAEWDDPEVRARFLQSQASLLQNAADCLRKQGKIGEASRLLRAGMRLPSAWAQRRRNLRLRRAGLRLAAANATILSVLVVLALITTYFAIRPYRTLIVASIFSAVSLLPGFIYTAVSRLTTPRHGPIAARPENGAMTLIVAAIPWMFVLIVTIAVVVDMGS